jgi:hypothetical protein
LSRQGKYWCWADIYDLVDNPLGLGFLKYLLRIRDPWVSVIPKPFLKNHWVDFMKEPEVFTDYLISSPNNPGSSWIVQEPQPH